MFCKELFWKYLAAMLSPFWEFFVREADAIFQNQHLLVDSLNYKQKNYD